MSMRRTRRLSCARQAPRLIAVVVLPTPPFWLAIAMMRPIPLSAGADFLPTFEEEELGRGYPDSARTIAAGSPRAQAECFTWNIAERNCGTRSVAGILLVSRLASAVHRAPIIGPRARGWISLNAASGAGRAGRRAVVRTPEGLESSPAGPFTFRPRADQVRLAVCGCRLQC